MAPGSSSNQNNNANNNNNRQTGTKPKSKSSKKNSVPQEMVAPTRRDLQQQLNVLVDWATVSGASSVVQNNHPPQQQHYTSAQPSTSGQQQQQGQNILLKPRNNRTPGEGTCYEIDNLSLQDNSRYIPVRPIVRRNLLNEGTSGEQNETHNTTVGVVIPTTPNSTLQQTFRLSEGASGGGAAAAGSTHTGTYNWSINNLLHSSTGSNNPQQTHGGTGGTSDTLNSTGVIPKQQQQQQQHILNPLLLLQHQQAQAGHSRSTSSPLSYRVPDGASQNQLNLNKNSNQHQQLQQQNHLLAAAVPSTSSGSRYGAVSSINAAQPFGPAGSSGGGGVASTVEDTLNQIQEYIKLTTNLISSVQIDNLNGGPRPQSVQSISTNQSTTPVPPSVSADELRYRMETQSKNMQALKEQQAHLLRLQQAARQQLQEMESIRQQHVANVAPPLESFQTVEQVQDGIGSIMERMRVLSTFIQNQQELSNMLGGDNEDVMADQAMLQQKFQELRDKRSQMHNLVSELQNMNMDASRQFEGGVETGEHSRSVPIELTHAPASAADARNATKTFLNGLAGPTSGLVEVTAGGSSSATSKVTPQHRPLVDGLRNGNGHAAMGGEHVNDEDDEDEDGPLNEEESAVLTGTADMLSEKINEINAMKSQLRRLKEMMDTVKLIEQKTGQESIDEEDEEEEEEDAPEEDAEEEVDEAEDERDACGMAAAAIVMQHRQRRSRSRSMSSAPITLLPNGTTIPNSAAEADHEMSNQEREQLNKRVEALQAMTHDLREQAKSIAAERDRLKHARNDLQKRRNNVVELQQQAQTNEKLTNHVASFVSLAAAGPSGARGSSLGPKERQQMELKAELENKRRELERIEKMTQSIKKSAEFARSSAGVDGPDDPEVGGSEVGSLHRGTPMIHPLIPPPPAPSAISGSLQNNTAGSNATNDSKTNSADSGVTSDIFAQARLESASYQSSSTRSFPPPMPDICNRNTAADRYRSKRGGGGAGGSVDVDGESAAAVGASASATVAVGLRDHTSPWPVFGPSTGAGMSSSNTGPHSPHYGHPVYGGGMHDLSHHHHTAGGGYGGGAYGSSWSTGGGPYGVAANLLPPHATTPNTPPDPIVFQHIMQTQQMLMNSITQCNQLLWIQQREINNLNNAVLLLQERILGTNSSLLLQEGHVGASLVRAESTPPNNGSNMNMSNAATAGSSLYARARSEQPMMSSQHNQQPQISPYTHYPQNPHPVLPASHGPSSGVLLQQQAFNHHIQQSPYSPLASGHQHSMLSPQLLATTSGTVHPSGGQCGAVNQQIQRNNTNLSQIGLPPSGRSFRSSVRPLNINTLNNALYDDGQVVAPGMANNNVLNTSASAANANETASSAGPGLMSEYGAAPLSHHHQPLGTAGAPNMINNLCSQSSQPTTPTPATATTMLPPQSARFGQHFNNLNNNQQQTQALNNQVLPGVRANNYWDNFRSYSRQNLLSSNSCKSNEESGSYSGGSGGAAGPSGVLVRGAEPQSSGQNQHPPQQSHHTPLNQSNSLDLGELQFHTNPINLGLANKTHPKASGHKKYPLSLRSCRDAGAGGEGSSGCYVSGGGDMNLASACTYQHDSKSTSKLFEALKENVYQEVKNLITANESRPHFLIQLFRELQLISSDPLRQRTLQSIQELYNRYIESTLQEENHVNNVGSNNLLTSSGTSLGDAAGTGAGAGAGVVVDDGSSMGDGVEATGRLDGHNASSTSHEGRNVDLAVELEVSSSAGANVQQSSVGELSTQSTSNGAPQVAGTGPNRASNQEQLVPLAVANSEIINIIMGDIVAVINSVDYINDSVLFKIAGVICNHAAAGGSVNEADYGHEGRGGGGVHHHHHHQHHYHHHHGPPQQQQQPSRAPSSTAANSLLAAASFLSTQGDNGQPVALNVTGAGGGSESVFSREDFLRHLESWNRTDKDEFISNLENFLNNILLRSSAVEGEAEEEEDAIEAAGPIAGGGSVQSEPNSSAAVGGVISYEGGYSGPSGSGVGGGRRASGGGGGGVSVLLRNIPDGNPFMVDHRPQESAVAVVSSSSVSNGYASTTYDLAEADQVCDLDSSTASQQPPGLAQGSRVISSSVASTSSASGGTLAMSQSLVEQHSVEVASTFDDRWTVVVQKKPITTQPDDEQPMMASAGSSSSGAANSGMSRMGSGTQQQQQQLHSLPAVAAGHSAATSGAASGGGNNGNNINNNWQSEEVADEHLEHTEEQHSSSYY
ncbi:hypothetical protein ZHAS_00018336 [Anopheles sinensis]|uniref:PCM1_C domain-containing protein n=1 Tax=Anopheles sinensis TaxID=74873 RepID=A0A084WJ65_ANOSI|nr:hypothetical protein ZHAS_00018336 [Anopheles sinensis]